MPRGLLMAGVMMVVLLIPSLVANSTSWFTFEGPKQ
jgi:hypothetical protein